MYGGIASAMKQNNSNAFQLFQLKNALEQQKRQNYLQDQAVEQQRQEGLKQDAARVRAEGIENERLTRERQGFESQQKDYEVRRQDAATKRADDETRRQNEKTDRAHRLKAEGMYEAGQALMTRGRLTQDEIKAFNGLGSLKLAEQDGSAVYVPEDGAVVLKFADGSTARLPADQFFGTLGIKTAQPKAGATSDAARVQLGLSQEWAKDIAGIPEAIQQIDAKLGALQKQYEEAKGKWFGRGNDQATALAEQAKALTQRRAELQAQLREGEQMMRQHRQGASDLATGRGRTGGGLMGRPSFGAPPGAQQAPYYLTPNEGEGGGGLMPGAGRGQAAGGGQQKPFAGTPQQAAGDLDAVEKLLKEKSGAQNAATTEQARGRVVQRQTKKASEAADRTPGENFMASANSLSDLIDKGGELVAKAATKPYEALFGKDDAGYAAKTPVGAVASFLSSYAKGAVDTAAKQTFLSWWNKLAPSRRMSAADLDKLIADAEESRTPITKALKAYKATSKQ